MVLILGYNASRKCSLLYLLLCGFSLLIGSSYFKEYDFLSLHRDTTKEQHDVFYFCCFALSFAKVLDGFIAENCLRWFAAFSGLWLFGSQDKLLAASLVYSTTLHTHTTLLLPPLSPLCIPPFISKLLFPPLICMVLRSFSLFLLPSLNPFVSCLLCCPSSSTALSFLALPLLPQSPWRSIMWPNCWGVSPLTSAWAATSLWTVPWPTTSTSAPTTSASSETGSSPARTP